MIDRPTIAVRHSSALLLLLRIHLLQSWRRITAIRNQSRLLTGIIFLFIVGYFALSYWLFSQGLDFVARFLGFGTALIERLLYILFALLFPLLLLSNLVIGYTNFFKNREAAFLLTMPITSQTVFRWKFIESALLASWAFLFLIAPLLVAFGQTRHVPWHFYAVTMLLTGLFIVLPAVFGATAAIVMARYLDRRSFQITIVTGSIIILGLAVLWWKSGAMTEEVAEARSLGVLDQLLSKSQFAQYPFLPSYWLSSSVLRWADGAIRGALFFALVLLSNVLFFGFAAFTQLGRSFYNSASEVQSRGSEGTRWPWQGMAKSRTDSTEPGPAERIAARIPWIGRDVRGLLVKDARMFWRDTSQWGQSVMLFGLLGVYIINLRHFTEQLSNPFWRALVAYLNLGACALNLATLTTRFVYPQFSLEGKRLWIIGVAPLGLRKIVKIKYWAGSVGSLIITLGLILLSCSLLQMEFDQIVFFSGVVAVMAFSLNGLAVGLGLLYPNFKEANPSKIVSGFGGTLCLVLSFLYILSSVMILGFGGAGFRGQTSSVIGSLTVFALLSAGIGWLPMRLGFRQLKTFEF